MLTASDIMTSEIVFVHIETSIEEAISLLLDRQISGVPVVDDDGRLVGMITEFALLATAYDRDVKTQTVGQHMTRDLITAEVNDPISRIADLCIVHRVRRVPVMQDGRLVGLISRRDVLRALAGGPMGVCTG